MYFFLTSQFVFYFKLRYLSAKIIYKLHFINLFYLIIFVILNSTLEVPTLMGVQQSYQDIQYCYQMPNSKEHGFTPVFRNPQFKDKLSTTPDPSFKSYRDVIVQSFSKKFPNCKAAGKIITKKSTIDGQQVQDKYVQSLTYGECFDKAVLLGKAIIGLKLDYLQTIQGMKFIGIYSKNRMQWLLTDLACNLYGLTSVPLYDTLGVQNLPYVLNQTQMTTLFLTADTLKVLLGLKDHGKLRNLVLFDRVDKDTVNKANKMGLSVIDFYTLIEQGTKYPHILFDDIKIETSNIYTFSYTSGTTGPPKGAMLSHENILSSLSASNNSDLNFAKEDVYLSFLPLPHVLQRLMFALLFLGGASVVFYNGDIEKLSDDCQIVKPTIFCAVPLLYKMIIQKVEEGFQLKTGIAKLLIENGLQAKSQNLQQSGQKQHLIYDKLVFKKIKDLFGGRIRQLISAGAPLQKKNAQLMQIIMSCPLYEVYGQTQCAGPAFINMERDPIAGHVGGICSHFQFRLTDIPEMKYTSNDKDQLGRLAPRGQIWLRGSGVIPGYYKLKDKTDEVITKDGWLKTGDVGVIIAQGGRLKIIDRKKNIFKLQQGEYVAPQKVQNIYSRNPYVEEVFVHGESAQNFCVAVIKPRQDILLDLARNNNINGNYKQLCKNKEMRKIIIKVLFSFGEKMGLNDFEQAQNIYLQNIPFNIKKNINKYKETTKT